jgi:hypothetical protein
MADYWAPSEHQAQHAWQLREPAVLVRPNASTPLVSTAEPRRRSPRRAALIVAAACAFGWWMARPAPLAPGDGAAAPVWRLQLSSQGRGASPVLLYGPGAGVHIMRAPTSGRPAVIALKGQRLRMISLGISPIVLRGDAGGAGGVRSLGASGRVLTVFRDARSTGVRTGF